MAPKGIQAKKSFKEEMEELLAFKAPPSSIDPEAWGQEGATLEESDDELYETKGKGREVARLRGSIDMGDDEVYVGKRASREGFFGNAEGRDRKSRAPDDDAWRDGDEDESASDDEAAISSEDRDTDSGLGFASTQHGDNDDDHSDADEDLETLEREMLEAEKAEAEAAEELKDRRAKEYEKAKAVEVQKKLWQSGLEARIMMQKVLQGANKLPGIDVHGVLADVDPSLAQEMQSVATDAKRALGDFCDILDALGEVNPASMAGAPSGSASSVRKRVRENDGLKACWAALDTRYAEFGAFRDASMDRWHRKTMIESGNSSATHMKILNQGISKQVGLLMKDVGRLAERSRLRAGEFQGLCRLNNENDEADLEHGDDANTTIPETYMDTEFYSALLNEFLDANANVATNKLHKAPKQRKIVDRRASKGRKLRYQVHEKLVNFMAPVEEQRASYTAQIFANLFGHRRTA